MIATLILAATAAAPQTPQAAALLFLQPRTTHSHPFVHVTAANARYAIVRFTGAKLKATRRSGIWLRKSFRLAGMDQPHRP